MTVYLDNAATTRVCESAVRAAADAMRENFGNPSSSHALGRSAATLLKNARAEIMCALGAKDGKLVFTSGGTEANNWALFSAAYKNRHSGRHIIISAYEHDSVIKTAEKLKNDGYDIEYLYPDSKGYITAEAVADALRDDTTLLSVMMVNNETGNINPVREIAGLLKKRGKPVILHTDAVQAFLKLPNIAAECGAGLITVSAHKVHGAKGAGALYIKNGVSIPPFICGGGQEFNLRSGTEAVPSIAAFAAAVAEVADGFEQDVSRLEEMKRKLIDKLALNFPDAVTIGSPDAPHIVSFALPGYMSEVIMTALDAEGICVSKGSACKKGRQSHVLKAMKLPDTFRDSVIRVSFSRYNTNNDVDAFIEALKRVCSMVVMRKKRG